MPVPPHRTSRPAALRPDAADGGLTRAALLRVVRGRKSRSGPRPAVRRAGAPSRAIIENGNVIGNAVREPMKPRGGLDPAVEPGRCAKGPDRPSWIPGSREAIIGAFAKLVGLRLDMADRENPRGEAKAREAEKVSKGGGGGTGRERLCGRHGTGFRKRLESKGKRRLHRKM